MSGNFLLESMEKHHQSRMESRQYIGLAFGGNLSAPHIGFAVYDAVCQCLFVQYTGGGGAFYLLVCLSAASVILAAVVTVIGVAMLSVTDGLRLDLGAVLSFGASIAFSLQMALMGRMIADCDSVHIALVENAVVAVLAFFISLIMGGDVPPLSLGAVGNFLNAGILCTGVYFVLQSVGQRYTSASKTALIITTESIFAAVISAVLYGERLTLRGDVGCILIFGAVLLAEAPLGRKKAVDSPGKIE